MSTKSKSQSSRAKAPAPKKRRYVKPGFMGRSETQPLVIAAREAYDYQLDLGNIERGVTFDDWRRIEVFSLTGRKGLTDCLHEHFRPLLARFKLLAGKDDKAFELEMRTGKVTSSGAPDDTRENREFVAFEIRRRMTDHARLADTPWPQLLAEWTVDGKMEWEVEQDALEAGGVERKPWPGLDPKRLRKAADRKIAIEDAGGPLREGYLVTIVRNKTRRPDLNLGRDIWTGLVERCTVKQLRDLLSTIVNRISAREGAADRGRNSKQKTSSERKRRSKKELAPRFDLPDDLPDQADPRPPLNDRQPHQRTGGS